MDLTDKLKKVAEELAHSPQGVEVARAAWQDVFVAIARELEERRETEAELRRSEERFRCLVERAPGVVTVLDADAIVHYANPAVATVLGYHPQDLVGHPVLEILHPEDAGALDEALRGANQGLSAASARDLRFRHRDGSWRTFEAMGAVLAHPWVALGVLLHASDVTERRKSEEAIRKSEARYALAEAGTGDGLWDWDLEADRIFFSPSWKAMIGCGESEVGDRPSEWFDRVHPEDLESLKSGLAAHLEGRASRFASEHRLLRRGGSYPWMLARGIAQRDGSGKPYRIAGTLTDISDHKAAEQLLVHQAVHDALTGLPNRAAFLDRVERSLTRAHRGPDYRFAVLFLDIDRFKLVNDSLGHMAGDQLLVGVARRLAGGLRPGDMVAHVGGDEFALLVDHIHQPLDASHVADRIQRDLGPCFRLTGHEVFATAAIGIALSTTGYKRPEDLLRDADMAMYRAKAQGSGRYEIFDREMHAHAVARLHLETDLRRAMERAEFRVHYQPIVSLKHGRISGFEALVRWQHPQRGLLAPPEFIPAAEETGLIVPICAWVLREACGQAQTWQQRLGADEHLSMSMNLASTNFAQSNIIEVVEGALRDTGLPGRRLALEITESMIMKDLDAIVAVLLNLKRLEVELHIDDFGTGYSSLSYLHSLPTDALKIDRSFVSRIGLVSEDAAMVRTIVELAHNLGRQVIAEGVETAEQLQALRALGCEYAQGFYFSKALVVAEAEALLASRPRW